MNTTTRQPSIVVGLGVVFGATLGLLAAYMLDFDLGLGAAYGSGTGIIVGATVLAFTDHPNRLAIGTAAGLVAGVGVGAVAAWSVSLQPLGGAVAGAIVGLTLGTMLALAAPTDDRGVLEPQGSRNP